MRPTLSYVKERVTYFNELIFGGTLPSIRIEISDAATTMGIFSYLRNTPRVNGLPTDAALSKCKLRISRRYDMDESEIEDTIIHELIHYFIWYFGYHDTSTHGEIFRGIMDKINKEYGRNITIRQAKTKEMEDGDLKIRLNYICVTTWDDGTTRLSSCARTYLFELHTILSSLKEIKMIKWYITTDPWFNRFKRVRTPKVYIVDADELSRNLTTATQCECKDGIFHPLSF